MPRETLQVALGPHRYRVERPWGDLPEGPGRITDVACDAAGRVYVQFRTDPSVDPPCPGIVVLSPEGERLAAWGEIGGGRPHGHRASGWPGLRRRPRRA